MHLPSRILARPIPCLRHAVDSQACSARFPGLADPKKGGLTTDYMEIVLHIAPFSAQMRNSFLTSPLEMGYGGILSAFSAQYHGYVNSKGYGDPYPELRSACRRVRQGPSQAVDGYGCGAAPLRPLDHPNMREAKDPQGGPFAALQDGAEPGPESGPAGNQVVVGAVDDGPADHT